MNAREFFELVAEMRTAQKEYFRTRDRQSLARSKSVEALVDSEISRVRVLTAASEMNNAKPAD